MRTAPEKLWDQYGMFDFTESTFTLTINTPFQIAKSDASRIAIGFAWQSNNYAVSTNQGINSANGIVITSTLGFVQILQREWGAMCNAAWFAFATTAAQVRVFESFLRREDPGVYDVQNVNRTAEFLNRFKRRTDSVE